MSLPFPWDLYLAPQAKLRNSNRVDDSGWGCEATLNRILSSVPEGAPPVGNEDVDRWTRSGSRRERHRARLRHLHMARSEDDHAASERVLNARQELHAARELVTEEEWRLLW